MKYHCNYYPKLQCSQDGCHYFYCSSYTIQMHLTCLSVNTINIPFTPASANPTTSRHGFLAFQRAATRHTAVIPLATLDFSKLVSLPPSWLIETALGGDSIEICQEWPQCMCQGRQQHGTYYTSYKHTHEQLLCFWRVLHFTCFLWQH